MVTERLLGAACAVGRCKETTSPSRRPAFRAPGCSHVWIRALHAASSTVPASRVGQAEVLERGRAT